MNSKNPAVKSAIILFILPLTLMLVTACAYAYQAGSAEGPSGLPMPKPEISLQDIIRILPEEDETGPAREDIPDDVFCLADEMAQETPSCGTDEVLSGGQAENPAFAADPEMMEEAIMDDLMTDLSGEEIRLGDLILRNQVTMLNVWGISCGPCLLEIPNLVRLREQYKDLGFEIIGLASDLLDPNGETDPDLLEEAREIVTDLDVTYPILILTGEIRKEMQIIATPTTFFVNSKGEVIGDVIMGTRSEAEWDRLIRDLLKETETR